MNSFERYQAVVSGAEADFIPRVPILMRFAAEYIGSNYGAFAADHRVLVEANVRCAEDFGIDQLSCISDPYRETQGFGSSITYIKDGVPRSTCPLADTKDLDVLGQPDPHESERMLDRLKAAEAYHARFAGQYSILGWVEGPAAEAADLRGTMNFLFDVMDDPEFAKALMNRCTEVGIAFAQAQVEAGVDTVGIGDAIASQISPGVYEELILPFEKRLVDGIRAAGAHVKLHICGDITHLLPGIATLDVDILDVDHMVDLVTVRQAVGSDVVLTGNLDPVATVRNGTPDGIGQAVVAAYEAAGAPFMVNAGCEIPSGTPEENLQALCKPRRIGS